jgi:hypothetical protein
MERAHLEQRRRVAAALRRFNNIFVTSDLDDRGLERTLAQLEEISAQFIPMEINERRRVRETSFFSVPSRSDEADDQSLFEDSPFSGRSSPISHHACFWVEDEVAHMVATLDASAEGAHDRAHGGIVAGLIDELIGLMVSYYQQPALTAQLNISYRAGAPINLVIEGTARLVEREGRRFSLIAELHHGDTTIAEGEALFVTVNPEQLGGLSHLH